MNVIVHKKNNKDIPVAECETTVRSILNTQRDFKNDELVGDPWVNEEMKNGFRLQRSTQKSKEVGRLKVPLAQLIDTRLNTDLTSDATSTDSGSRDFNIHLSVSEMGRVSDDDPYAIDIAALPTPMAAPSTASFQDFIDGGWLLDFCVAIDFTSSNGKG